MIITAIKRSFGGRGRRERFLVVFCCLFAIFLSFCFLLSHLFRFALLKPLTHSAGLLKTKLVFPSVTPNEASYFELETQNIDTDPFSRLSISTSLSFCSFLASRSKIFFFASCSSFSKRDILLSQWIKCGILIKLKTNTIQFTKMMLIASILLLAFQLLYYSSTITYNVDKKRVGMALLESQLCIGLHFRRSTFSQFVRYFFITQILAISYFSFPRHSSMDR